MPFVKLDCGIIHSSLWAESSDTRICWITLLVLADATGFVRAAASAIAREAGISAEAARSALDLFASPDDESRSPDNKGKRIERVDGGYRVLNYEKYRERDYTGAQRQKRFRERNAVTTVTSRVTPVTRNAASRKQKQSTEAYKKKEGANESRPPVLVEDWLKELESDPTYSGIDVRTEYGKMLNWCKVRKKQPTRRRFINWLNNAEKPLPAQHAARVDYKRNYASPPQEPEVTDEQRDRLRKIAAEESAKLREKLGK